MGHPNGSKKQYRYNNLHILEYEDHFDVHVDEVDPRSNPLGHAVRDAPEILVGIACGTLGGLYVGKKVHRYTNSKAGGIVSGLVTGGICFAVGMRAAKRLGER